MEHFPQSADVQWHACTLFGNIGLSLVLLVRLHLAAIELADLGGS